MRFAAKWRKAIVVLRQMMRNSVYAEEERLLLGKLSSERVKQVTKIDSFEDIEFKVFSQWGDDGIIQWLISHLDISSERFVEFGVEDYRESNTRFLLMNNNWSGLVMDGTSSNVTRIVNSEYYWRYDLCVNTAFVTRDNINSLLKEAGFSDRCGILHIDVDGNDYWIWKEIELKPDIVILEYNSVFGKERAITIPYDEKFSRGKAHFSHLYFGASLPALVMLSNEKGYSFVGCNSAGNNAYFVRDDLLNDSVVKKGINEGYVESKFRESRDASGRMDYVRGAERLKRIQGLPVYDVETNSVEIL